MLVWQVLRRRARVVERGALEKRYTARYRGFESSRLRQNCKFVFKPKKGRINY